MTVMAGENRAEQMGQIATEVQELDSSPLYAFRIEKGYSPVIGEGDLHARVMAIGEAPGEREAKTGRPFVGASGRLLDELFASIGVNRQDIYITNIVKDRPPENRDPTPEEIQIYTPFLLRQIELLQPRVIVTLGRFAMEFVLAQFDLPEKGKKISQLHGKPLSAKMPYGPAAIIPLYHPAVALYNINSRQILQEDIQALKPFLT